MGIREAARTMRGEQDPEPDEANQEPDWERRFLAGWVDAFRKHLTFREMVTVNAWDYNLAFATRLKMRANGVDLPRLPGERIHEKFADYKRLLVQLIADTQTPRTK